MVHTLLNVSNHLKDYILTSPDEVTTNLSETNLCILKGKFDHLRVYQVTVDNPGELVFLSPLFVMLLPNKMLANVKVGDGQLSKTIVERPCIVIRRLAEVGKPVEGGKVVAEVLGIRTAHTTWLHEVQRKRMEDKQHEVRLLSARKTFSPIRPAQPRSNMFDAGETEGVSKEDMTNLLKRVQDSWKNYPQKNTEYDRYVEELLAAHPDIQHEYIKAGFSGKVCFCTKLSMVQINPEMEIVSIESRSINRNFGADGYVLGRVLVELGQQVTDGTNLYGQFWLRGTDTIDYGIPM